MKALLGTVTILLLACAAVSLLTACSMTPEQTTAAIGGSASVVIALLDKWLAQGILTPEQHVEAVARFQVMGDTISGVMDLVRIWSGKGEESSREVQLLAAQMADAKSAVASLKQELVGMVESTRNLLYGTSGVSAAAGAALGKTWVTKERGPVYARKGAPPK